MGKITIKVEGSFPETGTRVNSAESGGHAAALSRAIGVLNDLMPAAIALDHELQDRNQHPPGEPFGGNPPHKVVFGGGGAG